MGRPRPRTVEGACARPPGRTFDSVRLGFIFPRCEIPVSIRTSQIWPRWFNSAFAARSLQTATRVANFDSEVPALNRREHGANPWQPTISASVVKLLSSSASNGECAGGSPAGCTNSRRVSPTTRDAPLRTERLGVEIPHAAPAFAPSFGSAGHFAHVVQGRDGALKTRTVSVQLRPWAPTACSPMQRRSAQTGKVAGASPATRTNLECPPVKRAGPVC